MLPYASDYGLRIFTMNLRDYKDSSPLSTEELAALTSSDIEVQTSAVRRLGREVASFVTYVCKTQGVPKLSVDGKRKRGGVALMTWSKSNIALLSILGDPETLEGESKGILPLYLRKMIIYGVSCSQNSLQVDNTSRRLPHERPRSLSSDWDALPSPECGDTDRAKA